MLRVILSHQIVIVLSCQGQYAMKQYLGHLLKLQLPLLKAANLLTNCLRAVLRGP